MKNVLLILIFVNLCHACSCQSKAKVLQKRAETVDEIKKKYKEDIIPPIINDVPDVDVCKK